MGYLGQTLLLWEILRPVHPSGVQWGLSLVYVPLHTKRTVNACPPIGKDFV